MGKTTLDEFSDGKPAAAKPPKQPTKQQSAEDCFWEAWQVNGLAGSDLVRQYAWHPDRKFNFDFAFPSMKVAVEIEGRGYGRGGGHHDAAGANKDSEKFNLAVEHGWRVLRYTTLNMRKPTSQSVILAVEQVCRVLCGLVGEGESVDG